MKASCRSLPGPCRTGLGSIGTFLLSGAALLAQPYGLEPPRPLAPPYLNMPPSLPVPAGAFTTENAFPNLGFPNPVCFVQAPRSHQVYVAEQEGRVWSLHRDPASVTRTLVLDLSAVTQGWDDCGLLSIAFHPEFGVAGSPNRGYLYVHHQYSPSPVPGPDRPSSGAWACAAPTA